MQKTTIRHKKDLNPKWHIVDAKDQVLGRLATRVATVLKGKHKTDYTPHVACGDYVVVINASQIRLTGNKLDAKLYRSHSGYPGHLKEWTAGEQMAKDPAYVIRSAVSGMLRRNRLRRDIMARLKVFPGAEHAHAGQEPKAMKLS